MATVRLEHVGKVFPNGHVAVRDLDLEVADGELLVLVGPSGCGKTTTLRLIAGLETPTSGRIYIGDRDATALSPQERDLAMVFQSHALYPHKTVRQNLAFGLRMRRVQHDIIDDRVNRAAHTLGLDALLERRPAQLSGGQRQRVALGRALVREPQAFLLDEPLSNLDAQLRVQTRAELARMHRRLGATMLHVTHDQEEAMVLGERVAILRDGRLQQVAPPMEIYRQPANVFVAGFIGSPAMNFFRCTLQASAGNYRVAGPLFSLDLGPISDPGRQDGDVVLGIRPQDLRLSEDGKGDVTARVDVVQPLGSEMLIYLNLAGKDDAGAILIVPAEATIREEEQVGLCLPRDRLHLFDAHTEERIPWPEAKSAEQA